jgi:hypothetical protein
VKNGHIEPKVISTDEKKEETAFRLCGRTHFGELDRLDPDPPAGPGAIDPRQKHQHRLLHLPEVQQ